MPKMVMSPHFRLRMGIPTSTGLAVDQNIASFEIELNRKSGPLGPERQRLQCSRASIPPSGTVHLRSLPMCHNRSVAYADVEGNQALRFAMVRLKQAHWIVALCRTSGVLYSRAARSGLRPEVPNSKRNKGGPRFFEALFCWGPTWAAVLSAHADIRSTSRIWRGHDSLKLGIRRRDYGVTVDKP